MKKQKSELLRKYKKERDNPFCVDGPHWLESSGALTVIKQEMEYPSQIKPDSTNSYNNVAELAGNFKYWSRM